MQICCRFGHPFWALKACAAQLQDGAEGLARAGSDKAWSLPLGAALLGVRQLGLNGWEAAECGALENELRAWQEAGHLAEPVPALRWSISVDVLILKCITICCCH